MGRRISNPFDTGGGETSPEGLIEKQIGSEAYDNIKAVAEHINAIEIVSQSVDALAVISTNADAIVAAGEGVEAALQAALDADAAKVAAETAETAAETANTSAQAARIAAEAAATTAVPAGASAVASAATATTKAGEATTAATLAGTHAANASADKTAANAAKVAAETAQSNAAASAVSAADSAADAALAAQAAGLAGGGTGQALVKNSNTDYDYSWVDISGGVPDGDKGDVVTAAGVWTVQSVGGVVPSMPGHGHVIADVTGLQTALDNKLDDSQLGAASGIAPLGSDSKISTAYLPDAVLGALKYQGTWNATTNTPAIPVAAAGNKGNYYIVSTAGTTAIDGEADWQIGDWIVSNGATWNKVDNSDKVSSVAGKTGVVTLVKGDVGLGNVDNTSDANKPVSTAQATAIGLKENNIAAGTVGQYWRGDKSWQTLNKTAVGLANVDNTSDVNKPVSDATQTALNAKKDKNPAIQSIVSAATVTPTFTDDQVNVTAQAAPLALANPTGTPVDGWGIVIRIKDNGAARAITYDTKYRAVGVTRPTTTVVGKVVYLGIIYNEAEDKWDIIGVAQL